MASTERRQIDRDMENRSGTFGRRTSPRKLMKSRTVDRHCRESPKSPLRSPLRNDTTNIKDNNSYSKKRRRDDSRSFKEETIIKDDEFPPLSEDDGFTPENRKWLSEGRKLNWSEEVEREEQQTQERSRRKLDLRDKLTRNNDLRGKVEAQKHRKFIEVETDEHLLNRRQKDLDYGKNTLAYDRYSNMILRPKRVKGVHPKTPNKQQKVSRRSWDAQVKIWRKSLHQWDPPASKKEESGVDYLSMEDIEDPLDGSSSQLSSIQEERPDLSSVNSSDAEDESSQASESPGITLTPDSKCASNPFKYPQSRASATSSKRESSQRNDVKVKIDKDDDGFFSGIDLEDMDTS